MLNPLTDINGIRVLSRPGRPTRSSRAPHRHDSDARSFTRALYRGGRHLQSDEGVRDVQEDHVPPRGGLRGRKDPRRTPVQAGETALAPPQRRMRLRHHRQTALRSMRTAAIDDYFFNKIKSHPGDGWRCRTGSPIDAAMICCWMETVPSLGCSDPMNLIIPLQGSHNSPPGVSKFLLKSLIIPLHRAAELPPCAVDQPNQADSSAAHFTTYRYWTFCVFDHKTECPPPLKRLISC